MGFAFDGEALPAEALGKGMQLGESRSVVLSRGKRVGV